VDVESKFLQGRKTIVTIYGGKESFRTRDHLEKSRGGEVGRSARETLSQTEGGGSGVPFTRTLRIGKHQTKVPRQKGTLRVGCMSTPRIRKVIARYWEKVRVRVDP